MSYSAKDYEFLGRQVAKGKYVTRSASILAVLLAFVCGGAISLFVSSFMQSGEVKEPINPSQLASPLPQINKQQMDTILLLEKKVKENPNSKENYIQLGNLYFDIDEPEKSIVAYEKALSIDPSMPEVLVDCGVMYRSIKNYDKALELFGKALKINPKHEAALFNRGIVLDSDLNQKKEALAQWSQLISINPKFKTPSGKFLSDIIKEHVGNR